MTDDPSSEWIIPQAWDTYTPAEHQMWDTLFRRQCSMLRDRASCAFLNGLDILRMSSGGIPNFEAHSERLHRLTGWRVVAVPGLVPDAEFFRCLANRIFVAGGFIRAPEQLDYLEEPDVFHDVFGHVPLLADPVSRTTCKPIARAGCARWASTRRIGWRGSTGTRSSSGGCANPAGSGSTGRGSFPASASLGSPWTIPHLIASCLTSGGSCARATG